MSRINCMNWIRQSRKRTVPDYCVNLIDARHMSDEELDQFEGDLKAFLLLLQNRFDRDKLKTVVATHRETWYAISKIKNDQRYAEYIDRFSAVLVRQEASGKFIYRIWFVEDLDLKAVEGWDFEKPAFLYGSLKLLSMLISKHYGCPVVILIDEYDVPLDKAYQNGYYQSV